MVDLIVTLWFMLNLNALSNGVSDGVLPDTWICTLKFDQNLPKRA